MSARNAHLFDSFSIGVVTIEVNAALGDKDSVIRPAVTSKINSVFGVSSPSQIANYV